MARAEDLPNANPGIPPQHSNRSRPGDTIYPRTVGEPLYSARKQQCRFLALLNQAILIIFSFTSYFVLIC